MRTLVRHPLGVIVNGRLFQRDEYFAADHVSVREWIACALLILGLLAWALLGIAGVVWIIWMLLGRGAR